MKNPINIPTTSSPKNVINIQARPIGKQEIQNIKIDVFGYLKKKLNKIRMQTNPIFDAIVDVDCCRADFAGQWSWGVLRDWRLDLTHNSIVETFKTNYHNKKTWKEIFAEKTGMFEKKHKWYSIKEIKKEAEIRLEELEFDDFQDIFRFRLQNKFRFYGFPVGNKFFSVWHDPEHKIYGRN